MENIDKMQNKCALPGNKFRDETEGALGRFMQGQRTGPPAWQCYGRQLAPPFGKLEEDGPALPVRGRSTHSFHFSSCTAQIMGIKHSDASLSLIYPL